MAQALTLHFTPVGVPACVFVGAAGCTPRSSCMIDGGASDEAGATGAAGVAGVAAAVGTTPLVQSLRPVLDRYVQSDAVKE